jgi:hypothetical protein
MGIPKNKRLKFFHSWKQRCEHTWGKVTRPEVSLGNSCYYAAIYTVIIRNGAIARPLHVAWRAPVRIRLVDNTSAYQSRYQSREKAQVDPARVWNAAHFLNAAIKRRLLGKNAWGDFKGLHS